MATKKTTKTMRARRTPKVTRTDSPTASKARKPSVATVPRDAYTDLGNRLIAAVPTSWLDPLLTGPDAIGKLPFGCPEIEALMTGVSNRLRRILYEHRGAL
jgi:hypothetical protein